MRRPLESRRVDRLVTFARLAALATASLVAVACADAVGPNTDVGLAVWTDVSRPLVRTTDPDGFIVFRVYIRNPSDQEIRVTSGGPPFRFTNDPAQSIGVFASLRIANDTSPLNAGHRIDWGWDTVYVFAPRAFHVVVDSMRPRELVGVSASRVGKYVVRGWFNGREGTPSFFKVLP